MTNHFVQPGWQNLPIADGGKISSVSRRCAIGRLAEKVPPHSANLDTMKRIISTTVDSGGAMWDGTLFQVVAIPEKKEMHIHCRGNNTWEQFTFSKP